MKVWVVYYEDHSGISRILSTKGQATLYNRWAEDGKGTIQEYDVEAFADTLAELNAS